MAEAWFALSPEDQKEALAVAAEESGWPANLLEKNIWGHPLPTADPSDGYQLRVCAADGATGVRRPFDG